MKAYCINLPERCERWELFLTNKFPFDVERVDAIKDNPGWKGCTKSHLKVFDIVREYPFILFEDDCQMLLEWDEVESIMKQLPENWDMFYLGATLNERLERYSANLCRIKNAWTTHAIIYNNKKAVDFIRFNRDKIRKIDVFITQKVHPRFECFITAPFAATQRPGYSDVVNKKVDYAVIQERYKKYIE